MELRPLALCGEPLQLQLSSFVAQPRRAVGLTIPYLCPTYLSPCYSFFSFKDFSASRLIFLTKSCFVNSCYFVCLWKEVSSGSSCSAILANRVTRVLL